MNSHAILISQGWRGKGNSLHPTDNSIGLSKPLLIGRKADKTGVGKVLHYTSDQWWLNAFDQKLRGLDTSKTGAVTQTVKQGKLDAIAVGSGKYAGLYADFVSGGTLGGSLTPEDDVELRVLERWWRVGGGAAGRAFDCHGDEKEGVQRAGDAP